jgi:hypothetical protein
LNQHQRIAEVGHRWNSGIRSTMLVESAVFVSRWYGRESGETGGQTNLVVPNRRHGKTECRCRSVRVVVSRSQGRPPDLPATLRPELHAERSFEGKPVDRIRDGRNCGHPQRTHDLWSRRSILAEAARQHLLVVDDEPAPAQLAAAQKAARPAKPGHLAWIRVALRPTRKQENALTDFSSARQTAGDESILPDKRSAVKPHRSA